MNTAQKIEHSKEENTLKKTPLYNNHIGLGGKVVPFAGWALPVQYEGLIEEHLWVRESAGIFDVSHMGEIKVTGPDANEFMDFVCCGSVGRLPVGRAKYTALLNHSGGVVDDIIVYRLGEEEENSYLLCVNASNTEECLSWLNDCSDIFAGSIVIENESSKYAQIALQGPKAIKVLSSLSWVPESIVDLKAFRFIVIKLDSCDVIVARTGYTGEDGFELFMPVELAGDVWNQLVNHQDVKPIGLGARDTLRLEACYPLHGNDLSSDVSLLESGLMWVVTWSKQSFVGKEGLMKTRETGIKKELVAFRLLGKGIARHADGVFNDENIQVGDVTSGTRSPSLRQSIGLARVSKEFSELGTKLFVAIRGKKIEAEVVQKPFYKRNY